MLGAQSVGAQNIGVQNYANRSKFSSQHIMVIEQANSKVGLIQIFESLENFAIYHTNAYQNRNRNIMFQLEEYFYIKMSI